jgi:hypothetical protein
MEREYGADVACWAKNLLKIPVLTLLAAFFYHQSYLFTTGTIKYSSVQCEISAPSLRHYMAKQTFLKFFMELV